MIVVSGHCFWNTKCQLTLHLRLKTFNDLHVGSTSIEHDSCYGYKMPQVATALLQLCRVILFNMKATMDGIGYARTSDMLLAIKAWTKKISSSMLLQHHATSTYHTYLMYHPLWKSDHFSEKQTLTKNIQTANALRSKPSRLRSRPTSARISWTSLPWPPAPRLTQCSLEPCRHFSGQSWTHQNPT